MGRKVNNRVLCHCKVRASVASALGWKEPDEKSIKLVFDGDGKRSTLGERKWLVITRSSSLLSDHSPSWNICLWSQSAWMFKAPFICSALIDDRFFSDYERILVLLAATAEDITLEEKIRVQCHVWCEGHSLEYSVSPFTKLSVVVWKKLYNFSCLCYLLCWILWILP